MNAKEKTIIENGLRQVEQEDVEQKINDIKNMFYSYDDLIVLVADSWEELYIDYEVSEIIECDYALIDGYLYKNKRRK